MTEKTTCNIVYTLDASEDIKKLPLDAIEDFLYVIEKLKNNIHIGKPLYNKNGKDLRGYYKLYFNKQNHRIVYKKIGDNLEISSINVAEIIAIGKRNLEEVYEIAVHRIAEMKKINKLE